MNESTYFADHWKRIETERIERYERMFAWQPTHTDLLEPLELAIGQRVLDYGCGPGFMSEGMANIVGLSGHVFGVDLNQAFVNKANKRVRSLDHISFHPMQNNRVPLEDGSVDRILCKNVLEYVPSLRDTLAELARVLRPDGRFLVIDSDWKFMFVEPWGYDKTARFFEAASIAFKTPEIGRRLRYEMSENFDNIEVRISAGIDTDGGSFSVLQNMASYISEFSKLPRSEIDELLEEAQRAIETGDYMFCLPQFLITGTSAKHEDSE